MCKGLGEGEGECEGEEVSVWVEEGLGVGGGGSRCVGGGELGGGLGGGSRWGAFSEGNGCDIRRQVKVGDGWETKGVALTVVLWVSDFVNFSIEPERRLATDCS